MGWRMHIAVVDSDLVQDERSRTGEYYLSLKNNWEKVKQITKEICQGTKDPTHNNINLIDDVERKLYDDGIPYEICPLMDYFSSIYDNPFIEDSEDDVNFTNFESIVSGLNVKEDYLLGRFDELRNFGKPFYLDPAAQEQFCHYEPRILRKEDFEEIIDTIRKMVVEQYSEVLFDPNRALRWQGYIEAKLEAWQAPFIDPYNTDNKQKFIVNSYDLEYRIFDLVRLYKSIDWMRDTVILFGW